MSLHNLKRSFTSHNLDAEMSKSKKSKFVVGEELIRTSRSTYVPSSVMMINLVDEEDQENNKMASKFKSKNVNEVLMKARQKSPPRPKHTWLDPATWVKNKKGNYTKKLGSSNITFYQNKDQEWKYVYQGEHSTSYVYFESALNASYAKFKSDIHDSFPM